MAAPGILHADLLATVGAGDVEKPDDSAHPLAADVLRVLPAGVQAVAQRPGTVRRADLHPAEQALLTGMAPGRAGEFAAGRSCARVALQRLGAAGPVLIRRDGAPGWPEGVRGSITHKPDLAMAVAARSDLVGGLGLDLEEALELSAAVRTVVLTAGERDRLPQGGAAGTVARLLFSAKEAYYKWLRSAGRRDPVTFRDVEVAAEGGALRYRPRAGTDLPTPQGAYVLGRDLLLTVAWTGR